MTDDEDNFVFALPFGNDQMPICGKWERKKK